jgi:hypothetical protein
MIASIAGIVRRACIRMVRVLKAKWWPHLQCCGIQEPEADCPRSYSVFGSQFLGAYPLNTHNKVFV